jgi:tRNA modification GTPase
VAIVGAPNAGKSSLFNALVGISAAIVGPTPGTTRDYLSRVVQVGEQAIELVDTTGHQVAANPIEVQAQALGQEQAQTADLLICCFDARESAPEWLAAHAAAIRVATKWDLIDRGHVSRLAEVSSAISAHAVTSARTGHGLADLKELLAQRARTRAQQPLASSVSRCRHHVEAGLKHLRAAHAIVLFDDPAELLALELRLALDQLGEMVGAIYTDDLLDRIFSRFCIGK